MRLTNLRPQWRDCREHAMSEDAGKKGEPTRLKTAIPRGS
jgi:hypothetical protein